MSFVSLNSPCVSILFEFIHLLTYVLFNLRLLPHCYYLGLLLWSCWLLEEKYQFVFFMEFVLCWNSQICGIFLVERFNSLSVFSSECVIDYLRLCSAWVVIYFLASRLIVCGSVVTYLTSILSNWVKLLTPFKKKISC
jgi:hypothetical protein